MRGALLSSLALALVLGTSRARAQGPDRSASLERGRSGHAASGGTEPAAFWADVSLFSGPFRARPNAYTVLGTQLGARMGIGSEARLSVDWGFAYALARVAGNVATATETIEFDAELERVEAQNPLMTLEWLPFLGASTRLRIGLSVAIPAAAVQRFGDRNQAGPTNPSDAATFEASRTLHSIWLAMNGAWAPYRYQPERVAVALPLALAFDLGDVELAFEGALAVSVPVLGGLGVVDGSAMLAAELGGQAVSFGAADGLSLGLRASLVGYHLGAGSDVPTDVRDAAQPSVEPWARLDLGPGFLTARGVVNLGGAFGLGSETGVWAVHVGGGVLVE
jgi:hypothetical protein